MLEVRVVSIELAQPAEILAACDALLPDAERRAHPEVRVARAAMRSVIGGALGVDALTVPISRRCAHCGDPDHGKPFVPGGEIAFSLTHSASLGLLAYTTETAAIGADIELMRDRVHLDRLAARVLDPAELAVWERAPENERLERFLRAWTVKEAYLKAIGVGIASAALSRPLETEGWTIEALAVPEGYLAALVVDRSSVAVTYAQWDPSLRMPELQAHPRLGAGDLRD